MRQWGLEHKRKNRPRNHENLSGRRYGLLEVLRPVLKGPGNKYNSPGVWWECKCDCGRIVTLMASRILSKIKNRTCGCRNGKTKEQQSLNNLPFRLKYNALGRGKTVTISDEEIKQLCLGSCVYCGALPPPFKKGKANPFNGIDRVDNSVGYVPGNCVSCCHVCNRAKHVQSLDEFISWLKRTYEFTVMGVRNGQPK